jgi:hypothetical protein
LLFSTARNTNCAKSWHTHTQRDRIGNFIQLGIRDLSQSSNESSMRREFPAIGWSKINRAGILRNAPAVRTLLIVLHIGI